VADEMWKLYSTIMKAIITTKFLEKLRKRM
jgi:hypothetical protein